MWPDGLFAQLVDAGYRVVRFDHRDSGLSVKLRGHRASGSLNARIARYTFGRSSPVPHTLVDMTDDVRGLLDYHHVDRVHVVGASMGGMIAEILAATSPDRVASLGVIMTTTGNAFSTPPAWRVIKLAYEVRNVAVMNGPSYLPSESELRQRVSSLAERGTYPPEMLRQFDAVLGTVSLLRYTKAITAPTVVLHGYADPMLRPRNGRAVAAAIPAPNSW